MAKYVCTVCGYVYDEAVGEPDNGIAAGTNEKLGYVGEGKGITVYAMILLKKI